MKLAERLAGMELSVFPVWVLDPGPMRVVWANQGAVELWRAPDREELFARDFGPAPAAVRTRLDATLAELREGRSVWAEWTFFPKGTPIRVKLHFSPIELDGGARGVLNQALPFDSAPDPAIVRATEALTHSSMMVALVDLSGVILMNNPAAMEAFKSAGDRWIQWLADPVQAEELLRAAASGEIVKSEALMRTDQGERWHSIEIRPVRDPVSGAMAALIQHIDETARRGAEELAEKKSLVALELDRALSIVSKQKEEILALAAPLLDVGARTIALPIIGAFDRERSVEIAGRLLSAIRDRRARAVILDLTGAASLDASGADHLRGLVRAITLLGARPIITGVRPEVAGALAGSGFDAGDAPILRTLADGIRFSLAMGSS